MNPPDEPFSPTLDRFRDYLILLARAHLGDQERARFAPSDIVQQTLLEAHQKLHQFRGGSDGELAAWLRTMLAFAIADALRAQSRGKRDVACERSLEAILAESSIRLGHCLAADQSSPSQQAERHEQAVRLADALARLPDAQRQALVLQHWQGWTLAQIGEHLGKTPAAVAGLLKRGLKQLRILMQEPEEP